MDTKDEEMIVEDAKNEEVVEDAGIDYTETVNLKPLDEGTDLGEFAICTMKRITSEEWKEKFFGFDDLRRLYKFFPLAFKEHLSLFVEHIVQGVENLRSSISRNALNLVTEVFSDDKDLEEVDDTGRETQYAVLCRSLIPSVCLRIADDKVFLSSRAKTCIELIAKNCHNRDVVDILWDMSCSKSIVIAAESNNALKENAIGITAEFLVNSQNIDKLLRMLSVDVTAKRQPFSKNAKFILKTFKEKLGEEKFQEVAKEVFQNDNEVKKIMQAFVVKKDQDSSKGFREFLKKKKSAKQTKDETAEDVFAK